MTTERFDPDSFPLWFGSAPMSYILDAAGPQEVFVAGEGCWVIDRAGRRYLDGRSGIGNMVLGYGREDIVEAMTAQARRLAFVPVVRYERPAAVMLDYAEALVAAAPAGLTRVRFTHTGSSAVETALLIARRYHAITGSPQRIGVVALEDDYHGSTLMTMAAGGQLMLHSAYAPMPAGFHHVAPPGPNGCPECSGEGGAGPSCASGVVARVHELGPQNVAAIVLEPINGLSGRPLPHHYLREVRALCDAHDILLVFDEVFSGLGRMGPMFAAELSGVVPDIMCLSKALAAGYAPIGAVLAVDRVHAAFNQPGRYFGGGSSTDGHPIGCAAALATLRAVQGEGAVKRAMVTGERVAAELGDRLRSTELVTGVRASGSYIAVDTGGAGDVAGRMMIRRYVQAECERRGVLIDYTPYALLLVPPYVLSDAEAEILVDTVSQVLHAYRREDVDATRLRPPSASGRR